MSILITSFKRASQDLGPEWSIFSTAVYQPRWLPKYPKMDWCDIRLPGGVWVRPRLFVSEKDPVAAYFKTLYAMYQEREAGVQATYAVLGKEKLALCCWCPYDKAAQRQLGEHGSYICHTAVVGKFLTDLGYEVEYDADRDKMVRMK